MTGLYLANLPPANVLQVHMAANQSVTDATSTVIKFDTVDIDTQSAYSVSTGRYTPIKAGKYQVTVTAQGQVATAMAFIQVFISKNGVAQTGSSRATQGPAASTTSNNASVNQIVTMNGTNDTIEADIFISGTGGSDAVVGNASPFTTMSIIYLGL